MKVKQINSLAYDAHAGTMVLDCVDNLGQEKLLELPVGEREDFVGLIVTALGESDRENSPKISTATAEAIAVRAETTSKGEMWISFQFRLLGAGTVRFRVPISQRNEIQSKKVELLFRAALQEMQRPSADDLHLSPKRRVECVDAVDLS